MVVPFHGPMTTQRDNREGGLYYDSGIFFLQFVSTPPQLGCSYVRRFAHLLFLVIPKHWPPAIEATDNACGVRKSEYAFFFFGAFVQWRSREQRIDAVRGTHLPSSRCRLATL